MIKTILAIETSCDDTCIAILKSEIHRTRTSSVRGKQNPKSKKGEFDFEILSNIISSQAKIHAKYGGVYPFLAKREHLQNLPIVLNKALREASSKISKSEIPARNASRSDADRLNPKQVPNYKFPIPKIDFIAVTIGPGLEPCLWTGINFAEKLAKELKIPIIPINHIEAHILVNFINLKSFNLNLKSIFPAICLIVSGGHTQLILTKGIGKYKILGETRDDAAGECFDKAARILGLGYPGGPRIAAEAAKLKIKDLRFKINLPRPMIGHKNYDFSFSGLKTAILYDFKKRPSKIKKSKEYIKNICFEIQQAIIDVLMRKTIKASKDYGAKTIILGGGVSANKELRKQFEKKIKKEMPGARLLMPSPQLSTDNAVMVALTSFFKKAKKKNSIAADANMRICREKQ